MADKISSEMNKKIQSFVEISSPNYNSLADSCQAFIDAMGDSHHAVGDLGYNSFRYVAVCYKYSNVWATLGLFGYNGEAYHCWKENGTWKTKRITTT